MNMMGVGSLELLVVLVVALLVLGPTRLASSARTLGKLARVLRTSVEDFPKMLQGLGEDETTSSSPGLEVEEEGDASPPMGTQPRRERHRSPTKSPLNPEGDSSLGE